MSTLEGFRAYLRARKHDRQMRRSKRRKARGVQHVNGCGKHSSGDKS